jgi:gliding motility-associated-like protein
MRKLLFILFFAVTALNVFATHNRAGEITYRQISNLTFEVTILTYTSTGPGWVADRPELEILWGDNTSSILIRSEKIDLPDHYRRNKYVGIHTYPGPGIYVILVEDPNRNLGVNNIPNSVNTIFSISTTMQINPEQGVNNTPILTQPPVDKAAIGQVFIHNPGAYDPDGDSISYKLTTCRAADGLPIAGYTLPEASNYLAVDAIHGDLIWNTPMYVGIYNVAMLIQEWRNNIKIGEIIRDMQIEVFDTDNKPPVIEAVDYICVEADSFLVFSVSATDINNDIITLTANGAPFIIPESSATFLQTLSNPGNAEGEFKWQTQCNHVRKQPYVLNIKAADNSTPVSLVDIKSINILVVGPAVENLEATSSSTTISLSWDSNRCTNSVGYNVYRKISPSGFIPEFCEVGVPPSLGYTKVAYVDGRTDTTYVDNNGGGGLSQGHEYCYLVCAVFPDGAEGYASNETCAVLVRGIPTITNVSVQNTSESAGSIYVAWSKPTEIEIGTAPGPYQYILYRSEGLTGENLIQIQTFDDLNDTTFVDNALNTKTNAYSYKVEFYNNESGNRFLIGAPHIASSIFLSFDQMENALKLNFNKNVPWINREYTVYRYSETTASFDSIGTTSVETYIDQGLINGKEYCYYTRSTGAYSIDGIINPIINLSQENCEEAIDTTPPCPPVLNVQSFCDSVYNQLTWTYSDTCYNDVLNYNIYFTPFLDGEYQKILTTDSYTFSYNHFPNLGMAGCYYMTAVDSFSNESAKSAVVCLDNCIYYSLPNVFTPNGDGENDFFRPINPYYFVTKIDIQIFNRWGQLMYQTDDPDINWNGTNYRNSKVVSDGVYYYICDVYEQRLTGIEVRHLTGFVHVFNAIPFNSTQE